MSRKDECFVVMPFGAKPVSGDPGNVFDFDRVYEHVMIPAIKATGLVPFRVDERAGPGLIHMDIFKSLRDAPVVLADLSLANPNVYYELGVRHVMARSGTVLMCCEGTELPFDIKLFRAIFYRYDGKSLDVAEVTRVQEQLARALEQARGGETDSPPYAFLESVLPRSTVRSSTFSNTMANVPQTEDWSEYQRIVGEYWFADVEDPDQRISELLKKHKDSRFGLGVLARYCLSLPEPPESALDLLKPLHFLDQYALETQLYEKLRAADLLTPRSMVRYGATVSEADPTPHGAKLGFDLMYEGLEHARRARAAAPGNPDFILAVADCSFYIGNHAAWMWSRSREDERLSQATTGLLEALNAWKMVAPELRPIHQLSRTHVKLMLLLRARDNDIDRADVERHAEAVLSLPPPKKKKRASWLEWYQIIIRIDRERSIPADGDFERNILRLVFERHGKDVELVKDGESDVGRRQYRILRRFLEQYHDCLRNPRMIDLISHLLQSYIELDRD